MLPTPGLYSGIAGPAVAVTALMVLFPASASGQGDPFSSVSHPAELCVRPLLLGPADPVPQLTASRSESGADPYEVELRTDGALCRVVTADTDLQEPDASTVSPGTAALYSALLPGMGQRYLGQARWPVYLGIEVWAWIQFFDERAEGNELQEEYRDLAWSVARRVSSGQREDGDFEYYEALTKFKESGAWDQDPQRSGIQPETDPTTFNGVIWNLAQEIFFPPDAEGPIPEESPAYRNALEYYRDRSIEPGFAWSWTENELQQSVYGDIIEQSDETLRNSTTMAGVIIANHVVSAVDALISARLRIADPDALAIQVVPFPDGTRDWGLVIRVTP